MSAMHHRAAQLAEGFEADVVRLIEQQLSVLERTGQIEPTHHLVSTASAAITLTYPADSLCLLSGRVCARLAKLSFAQCARLSAVMLIDEHAHFLVQMPTKRLFQRESLVSAAYKPVVASFLKDPLGRVPHEIDGASDQIKEELESAARWTTSQRLAQVEKLIAEAVRVACSFYTLVSCIDQGLVPRPETL